MRGKGSVHIPVVRVENDEDWIELTSGDELNVEDGAVFLYRYVLYLKNNYDIECIK